MSNDSIAVGELAPGDLLEHKVESSVLGKSVRLKADKGNTSAILIGPAGNCKYPLDAGESISADLNGSAFSYKLKTNTDKLYWMAIEP